jgi:glycosyltransferase involved in cell wall biosynthesis
MEIVIKQGFYNTLRLVIGIFIDCVNTILLYPAFSMANRFGSTRILRDAGTVFAPFSISEGLPNTLSESLLCECVAVGSKANGIHAVIRNPQYILDKKDEGKAAEIIKRALEAGSYTGKENREFIKENYRPETRAKALFRIIDQVI